MFLDFYSKRSSLSAIELSNTLNMGTRNKPLFSPAVQGRKNCNNEVLSYNIQNIKCPESYHFAFTATLFLIWERSVKAENSFYFAGFGTG
jgi:hypothetical protein